MLHLKDETKLTRQLASWKVKQKELWVEAGGLFQNDNGKELVLKQEGIVRRKRMGQKVEKAQGLDLVAPVVWSKKTLRISGKLTPETE